jgi:hypothetical protein
LSRQAIIVGNSVTYIDTQKNVSPKLLRRTMQRLADTLETLPGDYSFEVSQAIDDKPGQVREKITRAADRASAGKSLLVFYYFGHGKLDENLELEFVHAGSRKEGVGVLKLATVGHIFGASGVEKTLSIIDCCFAGARPRTFELLTRGQHCLMAATTPTALAYVRYNSDEPPLGVFTQALLEGFFTHDACVSPTDNRITFESLFRYAERETKRMTQGVQEPYLRGQINETISEYVRVPDITPGVTEWASEKTGYRKLLVVMRTLSTRSRFPGIRELYREVLKHYRTAFLTPYKTETDSIVYRPAQPAVLIRYVRFLRAVGLVEREELSLSKQGLSILRNWKTEYNTRLFPIVTAYLKKHDLTREEIETALSRILEQRRMPTRTEIFDYLVLTGRRLPSSELGLLLDLLGYMGALRVPTERVYFPW